MHVHRYNETMLGLIDTAKEKIYVLGAEEAQRDIERIREVMEDLQYFWSLDWKFQNGDWTEALDREIKKERPASWTLPGKPINMKAYLEQEPVEETEQTDVPQLSGQSAKRTIELTEEQVELLATYISMTTIHRETEIEACSEIAMRKTKSGALEFPHKKSDLEWWKKTHRELEQIRKIIWGSLR